MSKIAMALHGGAGTIPEASLTPELKQQYLQGLKDALKAGRKVLEAGGSSLDAVTEAVIRMEDNPLFNAGKGSVFNHTGTHEMDAAVMEGKNLMAGTVAGVRNVRNPVRLSRAVMEQTPHVMLAGAGAEEFARSVGIAFEDNAYFYDDARYRQWRSIRDTDHIMLDHSDKPQDKIGTVGAVALDMHGNIAAATSTGGMTNKRFGRIGDSPVIGAGTYANNKTCAISCTGHGELFLRAVVAYDISCLMEYRGLSLQEACDIVVMDKLVKIEGEGGLVAVDALGNIAMPFNSEGMYRASIDQNGAEFYGIHK